MPLSIGDSINYLIDRLLNAPAILYMAQSPVITAMGIVFVLMIIILFIFRDADTEDGILRLTLRVGFYSFLFTCAALFLHNRVLGRELIDGSNDEFTAEIFRGPELSVVPDISDVI